MLSYFKGEAQAAVLICGNDQVRRVHLLHSCYHVDAESLKQVGFRLCERAYRMRYVVYFGLASHQWSTKVMKSYLSCSETSQYVKTSRLRSGVHVANSS